MMRKKDFLLTTSLPWITCPKRDEMNINTQHTTGMILMMIEINMYSSKIIILG